MRGLRFSLLGFPIRIDPSFWLIAVLFGINRLQVPDIGVALFVLWVVVMTVSILLHELGHAVAFRAYGFQPEVTLYAMGGLTGSRTRGRLPAGRDVVVSLAGPLTGMAFGVLFLGVQRSGAALPGGLVGQQAVADLIFANLGWSILNLVPILPLDGGRTTAALLRLWRVTGAERKALWVSVVAGGAGVVAALQYDQLYAAVIVGLITFQNLSQLRGRPAGGAAAADDPRLQRAGQAVQEGRFADAVESYQAVLDDGAAVHLRARAAAGLASAHLEAGRPEEASAALEAFPPEHPPPALLLANIALARGRPDEAREIAAQSHRLRPSDDTAAAYATVLIRTGELEAAEALLDGPPPAGPKTARLIAGGLYSRGAYAASARAGQRAWEAERAPVDAYLVARAHAKNGDATSALDWLDRAVDAGLDQPGLLTDDPDLASLRGQPRFDRLLARLG